MIFSEKEEFEKLTATPAKAVKRWVKDKYIASFTEMGQAHDHHSSVDTMDEWNTNLMGMLGNCCSRTKIGCLSRLFPLWFLRDDNRYCEETPMSFSFPL